MTSLIVKRLGKLNSNSLSKQRVIRVVVFHVQFSTSTLCRDEKENNMTSRENVHHSGPAKSPVSVCVCPCPVHDFSYMYETRQMDKRK